MVLRFALSKYNAGEIMIMKKVWTEVVALLPNFV